MSVTPSVPDRPPVAGTSRFVHANGLRFHVLTWGRPENPPLLLLHGGGQTAHTWQRVANRLLDRYYLLAPDARGHGDTDWAPNADYSPERSREDVAALAEVLGLRNYVLIGMSMGGMTALAYAARHSANLRGLVIVDVSPQVEESGAQRILNFLASKREFADLEEVIDHAQRFNPRRSRENLRQTLPANLRQLPNGRLAWKWDPALFSDPNARINRRRLSGDELWREVAQISCPTLVVHGVESDILTRESGERLATTVQRGRYVAIRGAGHTVQGDNPHSLAEAIERFLAAIGY